MKKLYVEWSALQCTHWTHHCTVYSRVECGIFLIGQNRSTNQRSGMIFKSKSKFSLCALAVRIKVFIFKKFQGAQLLKFIGENWHAASLYNKEQTQKYKFEIWLLKKYHFGPPPKKVCFWLLKKTRQKKCFLSVLALIQF